MTNRIPLIVNSSANQIQELPSGDSLAFPNLLKVTNATDASSKTTGALQVTGGMSCQLNLHVGQDIFAFATSDKRLKDNITPIGPSLEKIQNVEGVTYTLKGQNEVLSGFIAQDIKEFIPEVVSEDNKGYLGVNYSGVIPYLVESIKELKAEIDELKSKL